MSDKKMIDVANRLLTGLRELDGDSDLVPESVVDRTITALEELLSSLEVYA